MTPGNVYHVWIKYQKGSGSNTAMSVAWSADGTRPTSGNNFASVADGTNATTPSKILWRGDDESTVEASIDLMIDTVKVANDQTIPSNP
jgi:hypothetical protein